MLLLAAIASAMHSVLFLFNFYFCCCDIIRNTKFSIILLYANKKNTSFFFLINVFWGVDSKSAIRFFRSALKNTDNPENTDFSGLPRFSGVGMKKWTSAFVSAGQKYPLSIIRQFGKLPLIHTPQ